MGEDTFHVRLIKNSGKIKDSEFPLYIVKASSNSKKLYYGVKNRVEIGPAEFELLEMSLEDNVGGNKTKVDIGA